MYIIYHIYIHIYIHYIYIHYTYNAYVYNVYVYTYHLEVSSNRATPNHRLLFGRGRVRHGALTGIGTLAEMWDSHRPIYMVFTIEYLCQIPSITIDLWDLPYQNGIYMVIFVGFYHQSVEDQWINHPTDQTTGQRNRN